MEARNQVVNAMIRVLSRANIHVPPTTKLELLHSLQKYTIIKEATAKGDMENQIERFLAARKVDGLAYKTLSEYSYQLRAFARHVDRYPSRVGTDGIRDYISYLSGVRKLKPSTMVTAINTLRAFFGWMYAEEIIKKNPMVKIKTPKLDKKSLRHGLSPEEIERMRSCCVTDRQKALFELFYSSGCRLSELSKINISDINFGERSIQVVGKGSKERTVYFSVKAKLCIERYLDSRPAESEALFLICRKPFTGMGNRAIQEEIKKIARTASIKSNVFPHRLRHSFATQAYNSGMSLSALQKLMGHDNPNTTQIYAEISRNRVKSDYDRLSF